MGYVGGMICDGRTKSQAFLKRYIFIPKVETGKGPCVERGLGNVWDDDHCTLLAFVCTSYLAPATQTVDRPSFPPSFPPVFHDLVGVPHHPPSSLVPLARAPPLPPVVTLLSFSLLPSQLRRPPLPLFSSRLPPSGPSPPLTHDPDQPVQRPRQPAQHHVPPSLLAQPQTRHVQLKQTLFLL